MLPVQFPPQSEDTTRPGERSRHWQPLRSRVLPAGRQTTARASDHAALPEASPVPASRCLPSSSHPPWTLGASAGLTFQAPAPVLRACISWPALLCCTLVFLRLPPQSAVGGQPSNMCRMEPFFLQNS